MDDMSKKMIKSTLKDIKERLSKITPGPWSWSYIGEKTNGYVVGTAFDKDGWQMSGHIDDSCCMGEEIIFGECVGIRDASTVNYDDARFIASAPGDVEWLIKGIEHLLSKLENK